MQPALSLPLSPEVTIAIVFGILFAEALAWFMMPRWYFSYGIPLFRSSAKVLNWPTESRLGSLLEQNQTNSIFSPFKFKQFDRGLVGFRESSGPSGFWKWGYTPVMRGMLVVDQEKRTVTLHGYVNYSTLLIVPATMHVLSKPTGWIQALGAIFFIALIVGGIYFTQVVRYRELLHLCIIGDRA